MPGNSPPPPRIHEDHITCPYCGTVARDDYDMYQHGENMFERECESCARRMKVVICFSRTASTYSIEEAHQWEKKG